VPSQDIVLGLYYLSLARDGEPGEGKAFGQMAEIDAALDAGVVTLHSKIKARHAEMDAEGVLRTEADRHHPRADEDLGPVPAPSGRAVTACSRRT